MTSSRKSLTMFIKHWMEEVENVEFIIADASSNEKISFHVIIRCFKANNCEIMFGSPQENLIKIFFSNYIKFLKSKDR